ncbi:UNVERIFIED_CONTAM: hypothetical protein FKN15_021206 [Acipenser sinensis]
MEFLLGSPFASPVGQRIDKATDGSLQSEDWGLNIEICDIINETEEGPKDAIKALKKRIVGNKNFNEVMLSLTELSRTCRSMQRRVLELIPRVGNEGLTEELLLINDDMNNVFMRYERIERRGGEERERGREVSDSTPDTSPASPAVIQSAAGSTVSGPPVSQSAVSSLSSQLASLNTGSSPASVSSTLQTLSTAPSVPSASKPVEEDEFDMFAQTRSSSLADQRKE